MDDEKEIVIDLLRDMLGKEKAHYDMKCQITFDCPVCSYEVKGLDSGDGKGNLEINYCRHLYKCWSCAETETHIGPWPMGDIGDKTCAGTFFCAHFKGPLCVYKLGELLGTNINLNEWKPSRPTPAKKYWDKLRDDGVIQEGLAVKDFKKSAKFKKKQKDFQQYLNTIQAERKGDCEKCKMVRKSGLKTY